MPFILADKRNSLDIPSPPAFAPGSLSADTVAKFLAIFCILAALGFGIYWRYIETDRPTTINSYWILQQQLTSAADQSPIIFMRFENLQGKKSAVAGFSYFLGNYVVYPGRIIVGESPNVPALNSAEDILSVNRNATNQWAVQHGAGISFTISSNGDHLSVNQQLLSPPSPKAPTP